MKRVVCKMKKYFAIKLILFIAIFIGIGQISFGQNIDIAIYESATANKVEIKLRPDFQIDPIETISGILYTIAWDDPTISIIPDYIYPYFVAPQGPPVLDNGIYHQVFAAVPLIPVGITINPGDEVLISSFTFTGGACSYFEIIEDEWTFANNGDYYCELLGADVTGIIYEPIVNYGPMGGYVTGSGIVALGLSTAPLVLTDYSGTVTHWEKRMNGGAWAVIPGTAGLTTYSEIPSSAGLWEYRAEVAFGSCPNVYSTQAYVTVLDLDLNRWTGAISDDWFTLGNWSSSIPSPTGEAIIPMVDPQPYPVIHGAAECFSLTIAQGASLTIQTDGSLTAHGDFVNNGQFMVESISGSDGSFIDNGTISGVGSFKVGRFIAATYWHYVSPPISDALSGMFLNIYLLKWNEPSGTFTYITPIDVPLNPMEGYGTWASIDLTNDTTVFYDGQLNSGSITSQVLTNTSTATHDSKGFNFVGNPYASAVDWNIGAGWTKTLLDNAIYIWNPVIGNYGSYVDGTSTNNVTNIIPGGQGFYVHVTTGNATGLLQVNNYARVHSNLPFFKESDVLLDESQTLIKMHISSSMNTYSDQCIVKFDELATENFDLSKDSYKILQGIIEAPNLYFISSDSINLSINALPPAFEDQWITLSYSIGLNGMYTIDALQLNNCENKYVYLKDLKTNSIINLKEQPSYNFYGEVDDDPARFKLLLLNSLLEINDMEAINAIQIYSDRNVVYLVKANKLFSGNLKIYDLTGKMVYNKELVNNTNFEVKLNLEKGIYMVRFITDKTFHTKKIFLTK